MLWRDLWLNEWAPEFDNSKSANNHRHGKIYECNFTMPHISAFTWQASILPASKCLSSFMPHHRDKNVQLCLLFCPLAPTMVSMTSHLKHFWYALCICLTCIRFCLMGFCLNFQYLDHVLQMHLKDVIYLRCIYFF